MANKPESNETPMFFEDVTGSLSDEVVDAFLSHVNGVSDLRSTRIRGAFVRRLIASKHPRPVRHVEANVSFGQWLENARRDLSLDVLDLAAAVEVEAETIGRLERIDILPWTLGTQVVVGLIRLFRLHLATVEQLFASSEAIFRRHMSTTAIAPSSLVDSSSRGDSVHRTPDRFIVANSRKLDKAAGSQEAIEALRRELENRGENDLLDTLAD